MKTLTTTLAILLTTLAPLAMGCGASTGDESSASADQAETNNGGGPTGVSQGDLEDFGYTCGPVGGLPGVGSVTVCVKGGFSTYYCDASGNCHTAVKPPPKTFPRVPVGTIKGIATSPG